MKIERLGLILVLALSGCSALVESALEGSDGGISVDAARSDAPLDVGGPISCVGMVDGTSCGEAGICLSAECVTSTCGDMYTDEGSGEVCDDANLMDGDGCERDCTFTCEGVDDCDDGRTCNGTEICTIAHVCMNGTPPAAGTNCTGEGGTAGVCIGQLCVPEGCGNNDPVPPEECDDGNNIDGDGCEADCTFECQSPADCDDGDHCNGVETCTANNCMNGTPIEPGTVIEQCGNDIDDDCDDSVDETNPLCYDDNDNDGETGGTGVRAVGCACDDGLLEESPDCDDNNISAFSSQRVPQTGVRSCGGQVGCMPGDFNCDNNVVRIETVGNCGGTTCQQVTQGWALRRAPACGEVGPWVQGCRVAIFPETPGCVPMTEMRPQRCL